MAELADAHGSGPCEVTLMQVQVLFPAPEKEGWIDFHLLFCYCIDRNLTSIVMPEKNIYFNDLEATSILTKKNNFLG